MPLHRLAADVTLYVVRHARAEGQAPEAALTADGEAAAEHLAAFLAGSGIDLIVSSPFRRAVATAQPLARLLGLPVHTDPRLAERVLADGDLPDWQERLAASFADLDLTLPGGESSRTAMLRAAAAVADVLATPARAPLIVTHGNLMALLLKRFDNTFGFAGWRSLTNPDLYGVTLTAEGAHAERLWR